MKSRGGTKGARPSKRLTSSTEDVDAVRRRPTASQRAKKTKVSSTNAPFVHSIPFQPPFEEPNNDDERHMESIERSLQVEVENTCGTTVSPSFKEPARSTSGGKHLMSCTERHRIELDDEYEGEFEGADYNDIEEEDEDYREEDEGDVEDEGDIGGEDGSRSGVTKYRGKGVLEAYETLKQPIQGGPKNPELLKSFRGHVAYYIWHGQERKVLRGHNRTLRLSTWEPAKKEVKDLISQSGLSNLATCMHTSIDMPLICSFVERWQPETNSFHLPFGEMTITLHDVGYILGIPINGIALSKKIGLSEMKKRLCTLFNFSEIEVNKEYHKGVIKLNTIKKCSSHEDIEDVDMAKGYLLWLLGCTLFVDRSSTCVSPHYLTFLDDLEKVKEYSWGSACLAFLYWQLGKSSRFDNAQIGGCLTLLQVWIFEYFPMFRPKKNETWDSNLPYALRWRPSLCKKKKEVNDVISYRRVLDSIKVDEVSWTPFDKTPHLQFAITLYTGIIHCRSIKEPYMPDRIMRQFGYVQIIPTPVLCPKKCYRGPENAKYLCIHEDNVWTWETWRNHCVRVGELGCYRANFVTEVVDGYHDYYLSRTHPRVCNDNFPSDSQIEPSQMSESARLQYIGARLYHLHPEVRHLTDKATFNQCLDDIARHMEDWMPRLQEHRRKGL